MRRDHRRVLARLDALEQSVLVRRGPLDERALQRFIVAMDRQFSTHMAAEDAVLYPALAQAFPEAKPTLAPLRDDHAELRQMLADLAHVLTQPRTSARDERLVVVARDLVDLLRLHIHREETFVIAVAARVLGPERLAQLAEALTPYRSRTHTGRTGRNEKGNLS